MPGGKCFVPRIEEQYPEGNNDQFAIDKYCVSNIIMYENQLYMLIIIYMTHKQEEYSSYFNLFIYKK